MHIRDYYFDWQAGPPATFVIERLDTQGDPRPERTPARVAALLDDAAREMEHSIAFWSGYQDRMLAGRPPNDFSPPGAATGGVQAIAYSHAIVALAAGEALVVEVDPADAPLWDVQLYNRPWYEALDFANRVTSTNHRLAERDPDGKVRVVIAARDPGVANWLDTQGREQVLATVRWWRPERPPVVAAGVCRLADVPGRGVVGSTSGRISAAGASPTSAGGTAPEWATPPRCGGAGPDATTVPKPAKDLRRRPDGGDVELHHREHGLGGPLGGVWVRVPDPLAEAARHDLPAEAEAVGQPPALHHLAALG